MSALPVFVARDQSVLFPTRVWSFDLAVADAFNGELCAVVTRASAEVPTCARGERTGWQSDNSFFEWGGAASYLRHVIAQAIVSLHPSLSGVDGMNLIGWANLLTVGDYFTPHAHAGSAWSGVYWVDAGDSSAESGGLFMVRDPRAGANMVESPLCRFDSACTVDMVPVTGRMIVFPSWLTHWVTPYRGARARVSVAFNAW